MHRRRQGGAGGRSGDIVEASKQPASDSGVGRRGSTGGDDGNGGRAGGAMLADGVKGTSGETPRATPEGGKPWGSVRAASYLSRAPSQLETQFAEKG